MTNSMSSLFASCRRQHLWLRPIPCFGRAFGRVKAPGAYVQSWATNLANEVSPSMVYIWFIHGQYMDNLWIIYVYLLGGWYTNPSEKYESQWGMMTIPIYGKIKNVPNHQPDHDISISFPIFSFGLPIFFRSPHPLGLSVLALTLQRHQPTLHLLRFRHAPAGVSLQRGQGYTNIQLLRMAHLQWIFQQKMVIFYSYVKLPEGNIAIENGH